MSNPDWPAPSSLVDAGCLAVSSPLASSSSPIHPRALASSPIFSNSPASCSGPNHIGPAKVHLGRFSSSLFLLLVFRPLPFDGSSAVRSAASESIGRLSAGSNCLRPCSGRVSADGSAASESIGWSASTGPCAEQDPTAEAGRSDGGGHTGHPQAPPRLRCCHEMWRYSPHFRQCPTNPSCSISAALPVHPRGVVTSAAVSPFKSSEPGLRLRAKYGLHACIVTLCTVTHCTVTPSLCVTLHSPANRVNLTPVISNPCFVIPRLLSSLRAVTGHATGMTVWVHGGRA
eukprot:1189530-Prorocentrum_minimum.AAC.1